MKLEIDLIPKLRQKKGDILMKLKHPIKMDTLLMSAIVKNSLKI